MNENTLKFVIQNKNQINKKSLDEIKNMLQTRVKAKRQDAEEKKSVIEHAYGF